MKKYLENTSNILRIKYIKIYSVDILVDFREHFIFKALWYIAAKNSTISVKMGAVFVLSWLFIQWRDKIIASKVYCWELLLLLCLIEK